MKAEDKQASTDALNAIREHVETKLRGDGCSHRYVAERAGVPIRAASEWLKSIGAYRVQKTWRMR